MTLESKSLESLRGVTDPLGRKVVVLYGECSARLSSSNFCLQTQVVSGPFLLSGVGMSC